MSALGVREFWHPIYGTQPLTEYRLVRQLERMASALDELIEQVSEWFQETDFPSDEGGYPACPGFVWSAYMRGVDVTDTRAMVDAFFAFYAGDSGV